MSLFGITAAIARVAATTISGPLRAVLHNLERFISEDERETWGLEAAFSSLGGYGHPDPPDANGEAEVIGLRMQDRLQPVAYRDLRISRRVNPAQGAVGLAHYGGGFVELGWTPERDGTIVTILAPHLVNDAIDKSFGIVLDPSAGKRSIQIMHADGQAIQMLDDGGKKTIYLVGGGGAASITLSTAGLKLRSDAGVVIPSALIVGQAQLPPEDPNAPQSLARAAEVIDLANALLTALVGLSNQIMAPPQTAPGISFAIADVQAKIAALQATGTAQTIKASPV